MLDKNRFALKEWAVIVRELGEGRQIVLLRKGGILEQQDGFTVAHREFFHFPTYAHQKEEDLVPDARPRLAEALRASPPPGELWLHYYAVAEEVVHLTAIEPSKALDGLHALGWPSVERRFGYRRPGLHLLALRVYRLPKPIVVPATPRYDGCLSWVDLDEEQPIAGAEPVLNDAEFTARIEYVRGLLAGPRGIS